MQLLKNKVPITQIHSCHLLDYEDKLMSAILSHCHYTMQAGEAHTVAYDFRSLQKHIRDKFIYGKPMILSDIPKVVYRRGIHTTDIFEAVRSKVKPQVRLAMHFRREMTICCCCCCHCCSLQEKIESQTRKEILAELPSPAHLRANLDVIDTVLGFLSSGGGKPSKSLGKYIEKVLKMRKGSFSKKVMVALF